MALEIKNLSVTLGGQRIVQDITVTLEREVTALLGLNGAGKSTVLKASAGILPVKQSCLFYNGEDLSLMAPKKRAGLLSYIPQDFEEGLNCTVAEFVTTGVNPWLSFWQLPGEEVRAKVKAVLEQFGILHLADRSMADLSGGEKKLTYLSRTKVQGAEFLLLDEPTAHLDYQKQHQFLETLTRSVREEGTGVLMTLHDPQLACRYADRILFLHEKSILGEVRREQADYKAKLNRFLKLLYGEPLRLKSVEQEIFLTWEDKGGLC